MPDWPHAPLHRFADAGMYFVTGATYRKQHFFRERASLDALQSALFTQSQKHLCGLHAWSLFSNHYHLVIKTADGERLRSMLKAFHIDTAITINRRDAANGRKVWFQFRETLLTYERSWLARLRYTHENAVHHGVVRVANQYPWCSAAWFERTARPAFVETVSRMKIDRLGVSDDFDAAAPQPL